MAARKCSDGIHFAVVSPTGAPIIVYFFPFLRTRPASMYIVSPLWTPIVRLSYNFVLMVRFFSPRHSGLIECPSPFPASVNFIQQPPDIRAAALSYNSQNLGPTTPDDFSPSDCLTVPPSQTLPFPSTRVTSLACLGRNLSLLSSPAWSTLMAVRFRRDLVRFSLPFDHITCFSSVAFFRILLCTA